MLKLALDSDPSVQHPMPEGSALGLKTAALVGTVLQEGDSQEHVPTLRPCFGGGRAEGPDHSPWVGEEGMRDATAGPDRGEIH